MAQDVLIQIHLFVGAVAAPWVEGGLSTAPVGPVALDHLSVRRENVLGEDVGTLAV